ncbi:MAG: LysE family transporter [Leptolyngbyaceae cyanobacterium CSU_1_4]|nr:LysE family transporter [Leptolyngbyaceae cyanobacterium CSU_1_4]
MLIFLRGLILGFFIAAPVGPIGILCIRRSLALGRMAGLVTGLGAATADGFYGGVAAFGLTFLSDLLVSQAFWLRVMGGLFLCYLGVKTFLAEPADGRGAEPEVRRAYVSLYVSTVFLTLTNPLTILMFAGVFAGAGLAATGNDGVAALLVTGVFMGSALWWFLLSFGASLFRTKVNAPNLRSLNKISGLILLIFGIIALHSSG